MLSQNAQQQQRLQSQQSQFQPGFPPFMPSNPSFDPSPYFNLDPSQAAKQMAALNAASQARIANGRSAVPSANIPSGGTNSGPYLGGIPSINNLTGPSGSHDSLPNISAGQPSFHVPNNHTLPPGTPNLASGPSFLDSAMSQTNSAARNPTQGMSPVKQRQHNFLFGLANVMAKRGTPLPPALTGVQTTPAYDPNNTQWKIIEPSNEIGVFRLAGRDVELFKLWGLVFQAGGGSAVNNNNGWNALLPYFELPEVIPQPQGNGTASVAGLLSQYYMAILHPFEDAYKRNMQEQQRKAAMMARPIGTPGQQMTPNQGMQPQNIRTNGLNGMGLMNQPMTGPQTSVTPVNGRPQMPQPPHTPQTPQHIPMAANMNGRTPGQGTPQIPTPSLSSDSLVQQVVGQTPDVNVLDQDSQGLKRKLDLEDGENKRVKQKTAGSEPPEGSNNSAVGLGVDRNSVGSTTTSTPGSSQVATMPSQPRPRTQPSRRKIEYVPLAREVDTYGGRDLRLIEAEFVNLPRRRPLRDIHEWGTVDIESLTMSIRSRLSNELSYALTTLTVLSTMRGQTPGSGFPIFQCTDLLDEVLDLLEDEAFDGVEETTEFDASGDLDLVTHRELVNTYIEAESQPFTSLQPRQGARDSDIGPRQRPGNIVLAVVNIIRNLSTIQDNLEFLSRHGRLLDTLLRLCKIERVKDDPSLRASSPVLTLGDVATIRKDTLFTLTNTAGYIHFTPALSTIILRTASRAFQLIASYLVDPCEAVSPLACVQLAGVPPTGQLKPPSLADVALEVFTRLNQTDSNRQIFAKAVPQSAIWQLLESLVHRLPVADADFQLMTRELWLSYLEKNVMAIYSLTFLSPPELKRKIKTDRRLGFTGVMFRMVQKFLTSASPESRIWYMICARRAIEAMKVVDDGEDSFDTSKSTLPTMAFGMGYGEIGESGQEKGTGLLGGYRAIAWDILMVREVDEVMFSELETLARVE